MPVPVSEISRPTKSPPFLRPPSKVCGDNVLLKVRKRSWPPSGIASRAFIARLITASSSWAASVSAGHRSGARSYIVLMLVPTVWVRSSAIRRSRPLISTRVTFNGCRLAKARSCPVSFLPRSIVPNAMSTLACSLSSGWRPLNSSRQPCSTVNKLLKSCATPAGQLTQRLHPLRLVQLGLRPCPPIHLPLQALRGPSPPPACQLLLLQLAHREQRHAEQAERSGNRKPQIVDQIGPPCTKNAPHRNAEYDIERIPPDPLIRENTPDPIRRTSPPKRAVVRRSRDRLHDRCVRRENPPRRRGRRVSHQHRAVAQQQRGGNVLLARHGAEEITEIIQSGRNVDDPVEVAIGGRSAAADVETPDVGERIYVIVPDIDASLVLPLRDKGIEIGGVGARRW